MKKIKVILSLFLVLTLLIVGCSSKGSSKLSEEEIINEIAANQNSFESAKIDGDMLIKVSSDQMGDIEITMNYAAEMIQNPLSAAMTMEMKMPFMLGNDPIKMELYIKDDKIYMKESMSGEWTVSALDETDAATQVPDAKALQENIFSKIQKDMKDKFVLKEEGNEYIFEFSGGKEDFMKLMSVLQDAQPGDSLGTQSFENLEGLEFEKFGFTTSYDKKTKYPKDMVFFMKGSVEEGGTKVGMDMEINMKYSDYNNVKSITVPAEALEGKPQ